MLQIHFEQLNYKLPDELLLFSVIVSEFLSITSVDSVSFTKI